MSHEINLGGTIYISSRRGAELSGYSQDYIGQLARSGAIQAQRVSGLWYVLESSLMAHKEKADQFVPTPPQKVRELESAQSVIFDGKSYISAARASKLCGYSGDYVTQLAREGKIIARQSSNRWFVEQDSLLKHKKEKDSLLWAVQSESVGLRDIGDNKEILNKTSAESDASSFFTYHTEELTAPADSHITLRAEAPQEPLSFEKMTTVDEQTFIPIRVLHDGGVVTGEAESAKKFSNSSGLLRIFAIFSLTCIVAAVICAIYIYSPAYSGLIVTRSTLITTLRGFLSKELVFTRNLDF